MRARETIFLFLFGLITVSGVALFQSTPGYMDAEYYYTGGLRIATGKGFTEPFLWNYLDDPQGLPHPSHAYWMPLASLLVALGMKLSGAVVFNTGRLGFLLIAGCIPPISASLSLVISKRRDFALLAGILAGIPSFYLSYLGTTDTFGIYMLLGGLWFVILHTFASGDGSSVQIKQNGRFALGLGLISGLLHLARADGILWLFIGLLAVGNWRELTQALNGKTQFHISSYISNTLRNCVLLLCGYLLIMGPWMVRNAMTFGTLLAPGGARALWLANYDELYSYPASLLTPAHWWASGIYNLVQSRLWAVGQNLQSTLAVQGEIFLLPLILIGLWQYRKNLIVRYGLLVWGLTFVVMSFVFPFPGPRGGFFHSGAALQPLFWAVAPAGLDTFINWGVRVRGWNYSQANAFFRSGVVGLALMLAILVVRGRVVGGSPATPVWNSSAADYTRLENVLHNLGVEDGALVLVNNPPGYYLASGRPAVPIPNGDVDTLLAAAEKYGARYLLLEANHPKDLSDLYQYPSDRPRLDWLGDYEGTQIFKIMHVTGKSDVKSGLLLESGNEVDR